MRLGGSLSTLWHTGGSAGQPVGNNLHRVVEQIGFFTGLGLVIVFLAAVALGRFTVIGARERTLAEPPAAETVPVEEVPAGETTRPVAAGARGPEANDRGGDATVPASPAGPAPSAALPDSTAEETRVAGSPDSRDTTIA